MRISDWSSDVCSSDLTMELIVGTAKVGFRLPHAVTLTAVRASLTTASSSGAVTVDINEAGSTILSTKLTIDQGEKTSTTAAKPRSEEHTSELQSLMRLSYAVFCLKKKI